MGISIVKRVSSIVVGASVAAIGLEAFLVPNSLIDGGVVGISIVSAKLLGLPLGLFLFILNLPFIYLGYKKLGKRFAFSSLFGVIMLSVMTVVLHSIPAATSDLILAAIFGGAIVGVGVGIVIRYGGTLDGAEIIAILIDRKTPFTVGEAVMFMNLFIIGSAGLVFGWDRAMYSLVAYFVAFKLIDITVEGLDESKSAWIVTDEFEKVGQAIKDGLGRKVTYVNAHNSPNDASKGIIMSVITRIEEQQLKTIVQECDPKAFVVINTAHEVMGRNFVIRPKKQKNPFKSPALP
jgi:uncharacterized membrane-anchored protein YitT (DUF2179 family)